MCLTLRPANLSKTIVYAGETTHPDTLAPVHVLGYQNNAENLAPGPNAMLLPLPSMVPMGSENMIDTSKTKKILTDIRTALLPQMFSDRRLGGAGMKGLSRAIVFDKGNYTVVLAEDADAISSVLSQVPADRRPEINEDVFKAYAKWYPKWSMALCCFTNRTDETMEPLLWWFEPKDTRMFFLPTLDAHDGHPPDLKAQVKLDHSLIVGTNNMLRPSKGAHSPEWNEVHYSDNVAEVLPFLPKLVRGKESVTSRLANGDFYVETASLSTGTCDFHRKTVPNP